MSRTRATALCLVNWKGVFYERYQLDRHVTVLEGANGAGKTTVMIAAYVVLLPDLSRLRFTNLGETAATGGDRGIHGRLGEPGRPSYAVMELALPSDERLLAGVKLVRGAPPSLDATPFVITGLPPDVRLQDLFLVREGELDLVPELDEVKRAVKERGATLESFRSVKDYLAVLFERGVTPLRLSSEEDRTKLNEMLRTSMTGGISKALTTELRSFLLKEESGLGETLGRMRANLEACRRTRIEVSESRLLEREISGIYEAGQAMFSAALLSAREAAEEGKTRIEAAERALSEAEQRARELSQSADESAARQETLDARLTEAQADVARLTTERDRRAAQDVARARLAQLSREVEEKTARAEQTRRAQVAASEERAARKEARERAAEAYDKASHGLAHLQDGLEELHRRAHAHRLLVTRLAEAEAQYGKKIALDDAPNVLATLADALVRLDGERTRLERDVRDADARARDHARALSALRTLEALSPADIEGGHHTRARAVLTRFAALGERVARLDGLTRELAEAERLAQRQRDARGRAAALGFTAWLDEAGASARIDEKLEALERAAREAGDAARREEDAVQAVRLRRDALAAERKALGERVARHASAAARVARLSELVSTPLSTRAEVLAARDLLGERQRGLAARKLSLAEEREGLLRRAASVSTSGELDPTLLRLRDELGAELLASRYEDVAPESATWLEAQLGPLSRALVVDDMDAALEALGKVDHDLSTVWLVRADASVASLPDGEAEARTDEARDVVVNESFGVRVTRPVTTPMLGRRAREKQAEALRAAASALDAELESVGEQHRALTGARRELDALLDEVGALGQGDPGPELARIEAELDGLGELDARHRGLVTEARAREVECASQLPALRRLLGDAGLLEPPDHTARHQTLAREHAEAIAVRDRLEGVAEARRVLGECVDELRTTPPSAEELTARVAERELLTAERDRLAQVHAALSDALAHRYAESWSDAETAIGASASLAPALEAQHAAAREAVQLGEAQIAEAERRWEEATAAHQASEAERGAAVAHHARALSELSELGGAEAQPASSLAALSNALDDAIARQKELDLEARRRVEETTLLKERARRAQEAEAYARTELAAATGGVAPAALRWQEFAAAAREARLFDEVLSAHDARTTLERGASTLAAEAQSKRELLIDRLAGARGGATLAEQLRGESAHVRIWLEVRDWLRRRVPAQVADTGEPLEALERLRDHLDVLESRLARQELDLRGASEDVARGIEVQVRRAKGQVRRLNQHLDSVSFGSVSGVRVEMRRVERMEQILRALRDGETQELLFLASMPIEEALDEIFRRHGGGRGGGLRLLDYREYLDLVVEVRRRGGTTWEVTSPTKLSTGEAIGVGAALMMVVLTEWERDSHLLHGRRTGGSLRFLFLDEANRLSRDNLGILFDLCRNLDLQLLVAAPEVARAEGNTTYRLIRRVGDDGREEVIVSGRRALPVSEEPAREVDAEPGVELEAGEPAVEPSA